MADTFNLSSNLSSSDIEHSDIESTSVVKKENLGNVLYDAERVSNTLKGVKGAIHVPFRIIDSTNLMSVDELSV
jgi:hypothetical protein